MVQIVPAVTGRCEPPYQPAKFLVRTEISHCGDAGELPFEKIRGLSPDSSRKVFQSHRKGAKFAKARSESRSCWSGSTYSGKSKVKLGRMLSDR
jgi:hypothetical protein